MKKESYKLLAAIMLVLVATLTSCEKFSLDESGQSSTHDANANVTVRIHQVQNRTIFYLCTRNQVYTYWLTGVKVN